MRSQYGVNPVRRVLLHAWDQVRIDVQRDRHTGMARALARDLRMNPGGEKVAQVSPSRASPVLRDRRPRNV